MAYELCHTASPTPAGTCVALLDCRSLPRSTNATPVADSSNRTNRERLLIRQVLVRPQKIPRLRSHPNGSHPPAPSRPMVPQTRRRSSDLPPTPPATHPPKSTATPPYPCRNSHRCWLDRFDALP